VDLGNTIRNLRENGKMSISALAEKLEVSGSHISQLERNLSSPSITLLKKIANTFDVPITYFFEEEGGKSTVIKGSERKKLLLPNSCLTYEILSPSSAKNFQLLLTCIEVGGRSADDPIGHDGEECCFILEGQIKAIVDNVTHELAEGDSIYYPANKPHNFINAGDKEAVIISVISPGNF